MARKAFRLRKLEITRCDTVTAGANQDSAILIYKADKKTSICKTCGQTIDKAWAPFPKAGATKPAPGDKCPTCDQTMPMAKGAPMPEADPLDELQKAVDAAVATATGPLQSQLDTYVAEKAAFEKAVADTRDADPSQIDKAALSEGVRKALEEAEATAKSSAERIAKLEDDAANTRWTGVAKGLDLVAIAKDKGGDAVQELAKTLKAVEKSNAPDGTLDALVATLTAAQARLSESDLFREAGSGGSTMGDAEAQLEAAAKALRDKEPALTQAQAYAKAARTNPELVRKMDEEALHA